ncbi:MAG: DUF6089 family protein [Bacteroidales bacterium]|nr:DUF6089 family protein [Bacteroidales bacterium]
MPACVYGQRKGDFGLMGGVTSYFGDINTGKLLYSPNPAGGLFYRYNFHPRHSLRLSMLAGSIDGSDLDFSNDFQQTRAASFSAPVGEAALQFEFNFLPYSTQGKKWNYSPYIAAGAAVAYSGYDGTVVPAIPLTLGFKINIRKNIGLEAEYGVRKTFYDNFDGLTDRVAPEDVGWVNNNDWYTFTGIAVTWRFYNKSAGCPAYGEEMGSKR